MRRPSLLIAAGALLLAGCGGTDSAPETDAGTSTTEAVAAKDQGSNIAVAQLDLGDFPPGWQQGEGPGPGNDGADPVYECLVGDLPSRLDEATVDSTDIRTFFHETPAAVDERVTSSSLAVDDPAVFEELHTQLRSQEVGDCLGETFTGELDGGGSRETALVEVDQARDFIDPGDDEALASSGISTTVALDASADGPAAQARVTVVFLNTGPVGSFMTVYSGDAELGPESLAEWGRLLAERLRKA